MKWKRLVWYGFIVAVFIGLFWVTDIGQLVNAIRMADGIWFIPGLALGIGVMFIFAFVWYNLFEIVGAGLPYKQVARLFIGTDFLNKITPMGQAGGQPVMAYALSKKTDMDYKTSFATIATSDFLNGLPILTFLTLTGIWLGFFRSIPSKFTSIMTVTMLFFVLVSVVIYAVLFERETIVRLLTIIGDAVPRAEWDTKSIEQSMEQLVAHPRNLVLAAFAGHVGYLMKILALGFVMHAFGVDITIFLFVLLPLAAFTRFTPMPGSMGAYAAGLAGLIVTFFPVGLATAVPVAVGYRLVTYYPTALIGWVVLGTITDINLQDR